MTGDFEARVQRQIERLQRCSYRDIKAEVAQKRRTGSSSLSGLRCLHEEQRQN